MGWQTCIAQTKMANVRGSMTEGFGSELPRMIPSKNEWMSHAPVRVKGGDTPLLWVGGAEAPDGAGGGGRVPLGQLPRAALLKNTAGAPRRMRIDHFSKSHISQPGG